MGTVVCGGVSPSQPTRGLGSVVSSPSGVRGRGPAENRFWRILKATERSFLYLYDEIWRGHFALASPLLQILRDLSLCPSVIYAHGKTAVLIARRRIWRGVFCVCVCLCVSALTSCKSTEMLVRSTGSSVYNGVFELLDTSYSGRPVYRHKRYHLYLHYSPHVNCTAGAWVISDRVGSTSFTSMLAVDSATDPVLISPDTTWLVYDRTADQFSPDSRLSLVCYVSSHSGSQW